MNDRNHPKYVFLTLLAVGFLASGGIFVKLSALSPIATGFYRVLFSIPLLYPFVRKELAQVSRRDLWLILGAGAFLAFDLIFWNISFTLTTVANANLLANMVPFTIVPFSYFVFKKRFTPVFLIGLSVAVVGVFLLMMGKFSPNSSNYLGDSMAFLTSLFYAGFLLMVSDARKRLSATTIMFISAFGSCAVLAVATLVTAGPVYPQTLEEFWPLLGLTILSQIMGQGLLSYCVGKLDLALSSVLVLSQTIIAALLSFVLFHEVLGGLEILGILVVLSGIFLAKKGSPGEESPEEIPAGEGASLLEKAEA